MEMEDMGGMIGEADDDSEGVFGQGSEIEAEVEDVMDEIQESDDLFHFIPIPIPSAGDVEIGEAGPGPSTAASTSQRQQNYRALDDDDDSRVEDDFVGAGRVIRMNETLHERWRKQFRKDRDGDVEMGDSTSSDNSFYPFASELDWRIANWVIKDSLSQPVNCGVCFGQRIAIVWIDL
jgi:hypothetical protein